MLRFYILQYFMFFSNIFILMFIHIPVHPYPCSSIFLLCCCSNFSPVQFLIANSFQSGIYPDLNLGNRTMVPFTYSAPLHTRIAISWSIHYSTVLTCTFNVQQTKFLKIKCALTSTLNLKLQIWGAQYSTETLIRK